MFDYGNLSPTEFEKLCQDVLSRLLGVKLKCFSAGRDGGIDLTDSPSEKNHVVQVKHYSKSSYSSLITSLKKELIKLKAMKPRPKNYYICVSNELTSKNIKEIYLIFSDFMTSDKNIFTKNELNDFLNEGSNSDILRKNFKLWLTSDQILTQLISRNTIIDSEILLQDIDLEIKYFVQTNIFDQCLETLLNDRMILICGDPGVGKSLTSKMLTLHFIKEGYQVRYTTNGEISDIKKSIQDDKDLKELIFLDDCLGQYYLKLRDRQDQELINLLKYISVNDNKVMILNSRITIFNEAQNKSGNLKRYLDDENITIKFINLNEISNKEKANIFLNHLIKNNIPEKYYDEIRHNNKYRSIINHKNYNPRIIEYVTHHKRYTRFTPLAYYNFIIDTLNNPSEAWKEEFNNGLSKVDRLFMHTLFSLTDTIVKKEILEESFNIRIESENDIDFTKNIFEESKVRLLDSMIKFIDADDVLYFGVINPSLNDYMMNDLKENHLATKNILKNAIYIEQLERLSKESFKYIIDEKFTLGRLHCMKSVNNNLFLYYIYYFLKNKEINKGYGLTIIDSFHKIPNRFRIFDDEIEKYKFIVFLVSVPEYKEIVIQKFQNHEFRKSIFINLTIKESTKLSSILADVLIEETHLLDLNDVYIDSLLYFIDTLDILDMFYDFIEDYDFTYFEVLELRSFSEYLDSIRSEMIDNLVDVSRDYLAESNLNLREMEDQFDEQIIMAVEVKIDNEFDGLVDWFIQINKDKANENKLDIIDIESLEEIDIILDRPLTLK